MTHATEMVDITPTWQEILPTILILLKSDNHKTRELAVSELRRMAGLADGYVQLSKENR